MAGQAPLPPEFPVPAGARFALVATRFHAELVGRLRAGAEAALRARGVAASAIDRFEVPGAWELPLAAERLARGGRHQAVVALGCVVRGDTRHYEHVADRCAEGLMRVQLDHAMPVANAVLAVERMADAEARAGGALGNKGEEAALAALAMVGFPAGAAA